MKYLTPLHIFIIFLWVFLCLPVISISADIDPSDEPYRVILFISKNIRPYIEAADGIMDVLAESSGVKVESFNLDKMGAAAAEDLAHELRLGKSISLLAAVGPEAVSFTWGAFQNEIPPKLYAIILNPERLIGTGAGFCGIPLNIPAHIQLEMIHTAFDSVKRVGIFYDPANNEQFVLDAVASAANMGIAIVPLQVSSMKEIPVLLEKALVSVDCIWLIPDKTVISESIAQYMIKQAIIKRIPVVGYNQFFYESGAAMSFVFDYGELGRQAGELAEEIVARHTPCERQVPVFEAWLNGGVVEKLGIKIPDTLALPMKMGP
jgi:putative tryptophan/tyrosine transport system substrate-binding protein